MGRRGINERSRLHPTIIIPTSAGTPWRYFTKSERIRVGDGDNDSDGGDKNNNDDDDKSMSSR